MRAILLRDLGGPELLRMEETADPAATAGEAVVGLKAAALNHRDVWIRKGMYAAIKLPALLGSDGAGVVLSVGVGGDPAWVGREVVINPGLRWGPNPRIPAADFEILGMPTRGTYAEQIVVPIENLVAKPAGLTWEQAAAIPLAGLTAYRAVVTRAQTQPGEFVLVTGIGGGVATFALLIARSIGAKVIVTSSDPHKLERARELGAFAGVNYREPQWVQQVIEQCDGQGPHVVIDSAGGATINQAVEAVRPGGRIVNFGATTGPTPNLEMRRVFWKQIDLLGTTMGNALEFNAMIKLFGAGGITPVVDQVFPLEDAAEAHRHMDQAGQFGKIVLAIT